MLLLLAYGEPFSNQNHDLDLDFHYFRFFLCECFSSYNTVYLCLRQRRSYYRCQYCREIKWHVVSLAANVQS